jgi:hypothetical protein
MRIGPTWVETHRTWVEWMEQCLSHGREYQDRQAGVVGFNQSF